MVRGEAVEALASVAGRRVVGVYVAPGIGGGEVLSALADESAGKRLELLARDAGPALEAAAVSAGFAVVHRQVRVSGSLAGVGRPRHRPLTFRTYGEVGRRGMLAVLNAVWSGGPGPTGVPPAVALDEFIDAAPDTSLWRVAYHRGEPAGAMLPLLVDDDPPSGVLLYIGVCAALRRRGLGRALHAEALWRLRSAGAEVYRDSTTLDNAAMRHLFARAGCVEEGTSLLFARPGSVEGAPGVSPRLPLGAHVSLLEKVPIRRGVVLSSPPAARARESR